MAGPISPLREPSPLSSLARILYDDQCIFSGSMLENISVFNFYPQKSLCSACTIVTAIILFIRCEISYFLQLIVMNFELGKALLSLLFYTDNPYLLTTFSKNLSLLFPYFFVEEHWKACSPNEKLSPNTYFLTFENENVKPDSDICDCIIYPSHAQY